MKEKEDLSAIKSAKELLEKKKSGIQIAATEKNIARKFLEQLEEIVHEYNLEAVGGKARIVFVFDTYLNGPVSERVDLIRIAPNKYGIRYPEEFNPSTAEVTLEDDYKILAELAQTRIVDIEFEEEG